MNVKPQPKSDHDAWRNAWEWFVVEEHPFAFDREQDSCVYRMPNGEGACAIGCQLPDELVAGIQRYANGDPGIFPVLDRNRDIREYFGACHSGFLSRLQSIHDTCATTTMDDESRRARYRQQMIELAHHHGWAVPS